MTTSWIKIKRVALDKGISGSLFLCSLISILTTFGIIFVLFEETWSFFRQVGVLDFLLGTRWEPLLVPKSFGVLPLVAGTTLIVLGALILALPLGLLVGIYLSQFASQRVRGWVKPALEILAGIPTVVYGYFALTFITPVLKNIFPSIQVFNALSGSIVVGVMILPLISSLCDDAFSSVPKSIKEGAYAMGATSFEVIRAILIPGAASRILAALVLATSRAIGETMAVTLAAGATPNLTLNPLESIQTMTAYIVQISLGDIPAGGIEYMTSFAVGSLLFFMTLTLNILGQKFFVKQEYKTQG